MFHALKKASPRFFLTRQESRTLAQRVAHFEKETGCEIVFHLRRRLGHDPVAFNRKLFHRHGLHESIEKKGILISLALSEKKFAVWVDEGIEKHAGEQLRGEICRSLSHDLKAGKHMEAFLNVLFVAEKILKHPVENKH